MPHPMCTHILNHLKLWKCVLTTCLFFIMANAMAAGPSLSIPETRPTIPSDSMQKQTNHKNIDNWLPEEVELFDEPTYLKSLCVNLNGLSFNNPKKVTSAQSKDSDKEHWSESDIADRGMLTQMFKEYFGGEQELNDKCLGIDPEKASQKIKFSKASNNTSENRLDIRFDGTASRWTSLWSITRFVKCITKKYRNKTNEKEDPLCKAISRNQTDHFFSQAFQQENPNYFLSRALLPAQDICGVNLNEKSQDIFQQQIERCKTPSRVKVELVEGRIEQIIVKQPKAIKPLPVAFVDSFSSIQTEREKIEQFFIEISNNTDQEKTVHEQTVSTANQILEIIKNTDLKNTGLDKNEKKEIENIQNYIKATLKKKSSESLDEFIKIIIKYPQIFHNKIHNLFSNLHHEKLITLEKYIDLTRSFTKIVEYSEEHRPFKQECQYYQKHPTTTPRIQQELCNILAPLKQEKPLSRWPLERALINASDLPGFTLHRAVMNPPSSDSKERDTTVLDLSWDFQRWDWAVGMDNYGSQAMGPFLLWNRLDLNYFIWPGDKASWLHVRTTEEGELTFNQVDYRFPLWNHDFHGRVGVTMDNSRLGGDLFSQLDVQSKKSSKELAFGYTSQQDRHIKTSIEGGLFLSDITTSMLGDLKTHDMVTKGFLKWDANYHNQIQERGIKQREEGLPGMKDVFLTLHVAHGLKWFNNYMKENSANSTTPEATPDFYQLKGTLKGVREFQKIARDPDRQELTASESFINFLLPKPTSRVYVSGEMTGQWSSEPLLMSEKMSFGGRQFGSAYDTGKITGDHAFGMKGEVGWKFMLGHLIFPTAKNQENIQPITQIFEWSPFGFTEFAQVWDMDAQSQALGIDHKRFMTGGGGLRLKFRPEFWEQRQKSDEKSYPVIPINQIFGEMMVAWPLGTREVPSTHSPEVRFGVVLQMFIPELDSFTSKGE